MRVLFETPFRSLRKGAQDSRRFLSAVARLRPYLKPHVPRLLLAVVAAIGYAIVTTLVMHPDEERSSAAM